MLVQLIVKILHYWGKKQKLRHVHELLSRDSVSTSLLSCDKAHMQQLLLFASVIRGGTTWVVHLIHSTWLEATLVSWRAWLQCVIVEGVAHPVHIILILQPGYYYIDTWALYCTVWSLSWWSRLQTTPLRCSSSSRRESIYCLSHQNIFLFGPQMIIQVVRCVYMYC